MQQTGSGLPVSKAYCNFGDVILAMMLALRHPKGMARKLCIQYPGASFHVINCGNYRCDGASYGVRALAVRETEIRSGRRQPRQAFGRSKCVAWFTVGLPSA